MLGKSFRHIPYRFATMLAASMRAGDGDDDNTNDDASDDEDTSEDDGKNTDQKKRTPKQSDKDDGDGNRSKKAGGKGDDDSSDDEDESKQRKFTQEDVDRTVAKRLADERKKADRKAAEKQGRFEQLYNDTKAELETAQTDLEKLTKRAEAAEAQVHRVIDSQIKDWPVTVREMDPGKNAPVEERMRFVEKGKKLAAELLSTKKAPNLGGGHNNGNNGKDGDKSKNLVSNYMNRTYPGPKSARKKD